MANEGSPQHWDSPETEGTQPNRTERVDFGDGGADYVVWRADGTATRIETNSETGEVVATHELDSNQTKEYVDILNEWRSRKAGTGSKPGGADDGEDFDTTANRLTANLGAERNATGATGVAGPEGPQTSPPDPSAPVTPEQMAQLAAIAHGGQAGDGTTPSITDIFKKAQQENEQQQQLEASFARIDNELNGSELGDAVRDALSRYAELKATSETARGGRGRTKREEALKQAEAALSEAKLQLELAKAERKRSEGLYSGDQAAIDARARRDVLDGVRGLDKQTRAATNAVLEQRVENRGPLIKAAAAIGKFFMRGRKITQGAKGAGLGVVTGGSVALLATISGVGFPITLAGTGVALGLKYATKIASLDRVREENVDENGNAVGVMSDQYYDDMLASMDRTNAPDEKRAQSIMKDIFEKSRARGYEQADRARRDTSWVMGGFAVGVAVGGITGQWAHSALGNHGHVASAPQAGTKQAGLPKRIAEVKLTDIPHNAGHVDLGEGFYRLFGQYGLTPDQAHKLFADHTVMEKLVQTHDAYRSTNPLVGPYGIRFPSSGHVSAAGQKIIEAAIKAKGYNTTTLSLEGMNYV